MSKPIRQGYPSVRVRISNLRNVMTTKALISTTFWIVSMGGGMWFAPWEGDPGRTGTRSSAKLYRSQRKAQRAIGEAMRMFPGRNPDKWTVEKVVLSEAAHEIVN